MSVRARIGHWRWLWLPIALFVTVAGWAVTSPVGSAPDDDFHLASIWCSADVGCTDSPDDPSILVPRNVVEASTCYRYQEDVTAECAAETLLDTTPAKVTHVNQVTPLYPTGFYRAMSTLASEEIGRSVLLMRLTNAVIVSMLLALLLRAGPPGISQATTQALVAVSIPLGLFIMGSTNPSVWAITGVVFFWAFGLSLMRRTTWRSRRTWLLAAGATVSAALAITSRVDSAAYLAIAAILILILTGWARARRSLPAVALLAALAGFGALTYLSFDTPGGGAEGTMGTASRGWGLLLTNATQLPVLIEGIVGRWALGWNDTPMPPFVPFVGLLVIGGLLWAGVSRLDRAKAMALAVATAALIAVPLWFLQKEGLGIGEVVQPRYLMPLAILVLAIALLDPRVTRVLRLPRTPTGVASGSLWASATLAFWVNAHRYAYGPEVGLFDLQVSAQWEGLIGVHPVLVTSVVLVATGLLMIGSFWPHLARSEPDHTADRVRP